MLTKFTLTQLGQVVLCAIQRTFSFSVHIHSMSFNRKWKLRWPPTPQNNAPRICVASLPCCKVQWASWSPRRDSAFAHLCRVRRFDGIDTRYSWRWLTCLSACYPTDSRRLPYCRALLVRGKAHSIHFHVHSAPTTLVGAFVSLSIQQ